MEFHTVAPASLPATTQQYQSQAIITLTHHKEQPGFLSGRRRSSVQAARPLVGKPVKEEDEEPSGLKRIISGGRRLSSGGHPAADTGSFGAPGQPVTAGAQVGKSSEGTVLKHYGQTGSTGSTEGTLAGAGGQPPALKRRGSAELKTGKWHAKVMTGATPTHLVLTLATNELLHSAGSQFPLFSGNQNGTSDKPGIGDKIKSIFTRRASSTGTSEQTQQGSAADSNDAATDVTGATNTASDAPLTATGGQTSFTAPVEKTYPAFLHGDPVKYIVIPWGSIELDDVKKTESKGVHTIKVPVNAHFGALVNPILRDIGQDPEESWGRTGNIVFEFDSNVFPGAKDEADVLFRAIKQGGPLSDSSAVVV